MDRRESLKLTAGLGLGLGLYPFNLGEQSSDKKLGIALVGLGSYATVMLAPALKDASHCYLAGIVSGTPEKRAKWKIDHQLKDENIYDYEHFDELATNKDIDIVYIVLPNSMHAEYTIRALEAGKHVICEKPMGMNADECRKMIAAKDKSGKKLQIGYRLYYEPHHLLAHEIGKEKRLGKFLMAETSLAFRMGRPNWWRMDPVMGGGGALMDLGVYNIQAARRMAAELPSAVTAQAYVFDKNLYKGIYETYMFQLLYPSGAVSNTTCSFNAYVDRAHASYERGWVTLQPASNGGEKVVMTSGSETINIPPPITGLQQTAQMDAFARNIMEDTAVSASGEEGLTDMIIIDAIKRAIKSRRSEDIVYGL